MILFAFIYRAAPPQMATLIAGTCWESLLLILTSNLKEDQLNDSRKVSSLSLRETGHSATQAENICLCLQLTCFTKEFDGFQTAGLSTCGVWVWTCSRWCERRRLEVQWPQAQSLTLNTLTCTSVSLSVHKLSSGINPTRGCTCTHAHTRAHTILFRPGLHSCLCFHVISWETRGNSGIWWVVAVSFCFLVLQVCGSLQKHFDVCLITGTEWSAHTFMSEKAMEPMTALLKPTVRRVSRSDYINGCVVWERCEQLLITVLRPPNSVFAKHNTRGEKHTYTHLNEVA